MEKYLVKRIPTFWTKFVKRHVKVFVTSLEKLNHVNSLAFTPQKDENSISRILFHLLKETCFQLHRDMEINVECPKWECPKQPIGLQDQGNGRLAKCPDFTCFCPNPHPGRHENIEISLHIECKILGKDNSYNKKYVELGMDRFDNNTHRYGEQAFDGIMIGYLVDSDPTSVQSGVNQYIDKRINHHGRLDITLQNNSVGQSHNSFTRQNVDPRQFTLTHIWVDLRQNRYFGISASSDSR